MLCHFCVVGSLRKSRTVAFNTHDLHSSFGNGGSGFPAALGGRQSLKQRVSKYCVRDETLYLTMLSAVTPTQ